MYKNLELPYYYLKIIGYLINTCIVACISHDRIDSDYSELIVETLNQYVHLCSKNIEVTRYMLTDFLKNMY